MSLPPGPTQEAIGRSEAFLAFQERLSRVAPIDRPVLLIGERGTGKELAAARLHFLSTRWQGPLVALNCAALTPSLIESELFGYEQGAFTGARQRRAGRFETADGGTLFLDEIAAIPLEVQGKILRVVEYGGFERVGSTRTISVDVRIIGATNADLKQMAREGRFKQDLLDRLSFEVLFLPPLRERAEDIPLLTDHFASKMARELGREALPRFTQPAMAALESHTWPGNIRELKNVVERAVYRAGGELVEAVVFDPFASPYLPGEKPAETAAPEETPPSATRTEIDLSPLLDLPLKEAVERLKQIMVQNALQTTRFNQRQAAMHLSLTYDQFRGLIRKYGKGPSSDAPNTKTTM